MYAIILCSYLHCVKKILYENQDTASNVFSRQRSRYSSAWRFLSFLRQQADFLFLHGWTYPAGHDALEEIQRLLLILSVKSCHAVLSDLFSSYLSSVRHLPYVFRRKSTGFPPSCSAPLFLANVVSECWSYLQAWRLSPLRVHFWEPFPTARPLPSFPYAQRKWIFHVTSCSIFCCLCWRMWNRQPRILLSRPWGALDFLPDNETSSWCSDNVC